MLPTSPSTTAVASPPCGWSANLITTDRDDRPYRAHSRPPHAATSSWSLEPDVLIGREGVHRNGVDGMVRDPRPYAMQGPKVEDRRKHHALHRELLYAVQQVLPLGPVALRRLLLKQRIDVRIAPIRIGPLGIDKRLNARRRVPGSSGAGSEQAAQLLLAPGGVKGCPLHGHHLGANAHRVQIIDHRLPQYEGRRDRHQIAGLEAVWIPRFGQQLLRL